MRKVMIVDDEPVIRFGLKASIDWSKEGFQVIGDFANGAEAYECLKREPADILITDIKMPVMDGLTLTKKALELHPHLKVILVSSYNEFEYAREGLKLGVVDYVLKPTLEPEELLMVVRKCEEKLDEEERLEQQLTNSLQEEREGLRRRREHRLMRRLVYLEEETEDADDDALSWLEQDYTAVRALLNRVQALEEHYGFLYKSIVMEQIKDSVYRVEPRSVVFQTAENELFFLLPVSEEAEGTIQQLRSLKHAVEADSEISVSFGYSTGRGWPQVRQCFLQSEEAVQASFFYGEGIYRYPAYPAAAQPADSRTLSERMLAVPDIDVKDYAFDKILEAWRNDWAEGGKPPSALKEEACRVISDLYKSSVDAFILVESFEMLRKSESLDDLCDQLKERITSLRQVAQHHVSPGEGRNHPVAQALEYIRQRYLETLTLQQVADYVYMSKNYFSILFKKTTGSNFIDYVIGLRIQKAKELLAGTDYKIYEVAECSGFNDVKYFSKMFKKMTGMSPVEYREQAASREST